jgi:hypothetical protein
MCVSEKSNTTQKNEKDCLRKLHKNPFFIKTIKKRYQKSYKKTTALIVTSVRWKKGE